MVTATATLEPTIRGGEIFICSLTHFLLSLAELFFVFPTLKLFPHPPSLSSGFILVGTSIRAGFFDVPRPNVAVGSRFIAF